jgi:CBS domain-containing protein
VRRIPVVNDSGGLEGLLTVDDLLELMAEQLSDIVSLISKEQTRESKLRR